MVMILKRTFVSLLFLLGYSGVAFGQAQAAEVFGSNPADGYISTTAYANAHFGFVLKIPQDKKLYPIKLGISGMIFGMQSNERDITMLTIDTKEGDTDATAESTDANAGSPDVTATKKNAKTANKDAKTPGSDARKMVSISGHPTKVMIAGTEFWKTTQTKNTEVGKSTELIYAGVLHGQVVRFVLVSFFHSELEKEWKSAIEGMQIIDPKAAKDAAGPGAITYEDRIAGKHPTTVTSGPTPTTAAPAKPN